MRSRLFVIGCIAIAGLTVAQTAWAYCTCGATWPAGAYEDSQAVFQGTVLSTKTVYVGLTRWQEAKLTVERSWKGAGGNTLSIRSLIGKDECGVDFQAGESYLVYAKSDTAGTLSTGKCQRTQLADLAKDDLEYLENRPAVKPQPGEVFSDVPTDHPNFQAVTALFGAGLVSGYADGTFRPERSVSRAEIVRILIDAAPGYRIQNDATFQDPYDSGWLHFSDVEDGQWFVPFLRKAVQGKVVKGYRDGTFRPNNSVTFAEAAKMVSIAFGLARDWDGPVWYEQYVGALGDRRAIPTTVADVNTPLTRGELAEIIWRIRDDIRDRDSKTADEASLRSTCQIVNDPSANNIDMLRVRDTWLGWYNIERAKLGLKAYVGSTQLDRTAYDWSAIQANQGFSSHSRSGKQGTDYDYTAVRRWFTDQGVTFANVNGSTFTENIGWGPFRCSEDDCTDRLIAAMRQTFDFYQQEREKSYHPHWNAVVNPDFRMLGLGIALRDGKYYLTAHIATEIVSQPSPLCR